jgi:2-oxoglutarate dehydrogenase E1 component
LENGVLDDSRAQAILDKHNTYLEEEFEAGSAYKPNKADWLEGQWSGMTVAYGDDRRGDTAVPIDTLNKIGDVMTTVPPEFQVHSKLERVLNTRSQAIKTGKNLDWATAEHLAFGSAVLDGFVVRLSGQDSCRGTFSQRHAVFVDQRSEERYVPLANLSAEQAKFEVIDSPLSEASVMGFEYGFAQAEPNALVMWEAQFGDFANGAQVVIDQFISSGESKWLRMNGLVLLLPHGYEGQGPEHSSARLERYLQLCAEDNMQVVNCTTPANYFHVLRRQVCRDFRKPLIVMTPKSLLRHKSCVSELADFGPGTSFHRILRDPNPKVNDKSVKRVILCSGKVYYDIEDMRNAEEQFDVKIVRIEQLYPFPQKKLTEILKMTPNADVVWCQEEPQNMGGWTFVRDYIEGAMQQTGLNTDRPIYSGRDAAASPATGSAARHAKEQKRLVQKSLSLSETSVAAQ